MTSAAAGGTGRRTEAERGAGQGRRTSPKIFADSAAVACGWTPPPEIDQNIQADVWEDTYAAA
jgi:hypothetical protein